MSYRVFNPKTPEILDFASDNLKSKLGDPEDFIDRKSAFHDKDDSQREVIQESQNYFNKESALYQKDDGQVSRAATGQAFFKQDEPIRGDILSRDKTVSAEPQTFFNPVAQAEYGRPDQFHR